MGEFDAAAASAAWDRQHRPVDLDPAPSRLRTNAGDVFRFAFAPGPHEARGPRLSLDGLTPGQKERLCRDLGIVAGAAAGIPQHELGRIYGLTQSRVSAIVAGFRRRRGIE